MEEIFKDIPNYEGMYQVSNLGNVKSIRFGKEKTLKTGLTRGYKFFVVCIKRKQKTMYVHQAVAMVFLNHIPCGQTFVVNHKNFNRTDNRLENLEIVTMRENSNQKHFKSTSKYVGVYWNKDRKKWISRIRINRKQIYLGTFNCELKASYAYINALKNI